MIKQKTIAAIVTPLGEGGIGKIIVSGPEAITIISSIFRWKKTKDIRNGQDWKLYYGYIVESGQRIDEVIVNIIKQRSSDTGEDTVEVNCHGGIRILRRVYELIIQMGAKKTGWDSLLQQSFENKKTDLIRKEAHRAIIDVKTKLGAKILLDQYAGALSKALWKGLKMIDEIKMSRLKGAESFQASVYSALSEHIETLLKTAPLGMALTDPLTIVILGKPNTGKSTIINTLIGAEYMIVHHEPGTTRDYVSEFISVEDIPFEIIDTAGMRDTEDELESMSIEMTREQLNQADRVILMFDNSRPFEQEDKMIINAVKVWSHAKNAKSYNKKYGTNNIFPVINKRDLPDKLDRTKIEAEINRPISFISAWKKEGLEVLYERLVQDFDTDYKPKQPVLFNKRQYYLLSEAYHLISEAEKSSPSGISTDESLSLADKLTDIFTDLGIR